MERLKHTILVGPHGTGRSLWARARYKDHSWEYDGATDPQAYKLTSTVDPRRHEACRGFRAPHHTVSAAAMAGRLRGHAWTPGELSLAHGGILFLDDLPEFSRAVIESLREPLETGEIYLTSGRNTLRVPARFTLIASASRCPCGNHGTDRACNCSRGMVDRYLARVPAWLRSMCEILEPAAYAPTTDTVSS